MQITDRDTIAAIATPPGRGGVGIIRISGKRALEITRQLLRMDEARRLEPRRACFSSFYDADKEVLDEGLVLYFAAPASFTGEEVVELQGHGGPVVMDALLRRVVELGARLARPGEFSERAFLNDKIDLAQAEAIADLIDASSTQAARSAVRSLQGEFSRKVHVLVESVIALRMHVEAAIDFPEEEIDFLSDGKIEGGLRNLLQEMSSVLHQAQQGALLKEGMKVVIAGKPNAGKSSLLNALAGHEAAIVTDIAGTTRDVLREHINIDGMPLHIVDTAGLRDAPDIVEREGIRRALAEIDSADRILFLYDATEELSPEQIASRFFNPLPEADRMVFVRNKIDLLPSFTPGETTLPVNGKDYTLLNISAREQMGIESLKSCLRQAAGFDLNSEGLFMARRRHVEALEQANVFIANALDTLLQTRAGELMAEDLRYAQKALSEITGEFTPDDLLGRIFSSFCIGK